MNDRYARQMVLPEVGATGQARLAAASVLVVGAGGLGCPVLAYLAAAGVGRIVVVDHDRIEETNLHRQPLYRHADIGQMKAQVACDALRAMNPHLGVEALTERLTPQNAAALVAAADVVVDAADSFAVTYVLSDACRLAAKALVSASALGLRGYAGAFCGGGPSYRAVFPELPRAAGSCAESGVLGAVVGLLGSLEAQLTLSLLLELKPTVLGRLISLDARNLRFGGFSFATAREPDGLPLAFIAPQDVSGGDLVIDLRASSEAPVSPFPAALRLSVESLESGAQRFAPEGRIVLCCRTGVRAWRAARALEAQGHRQLALIAFGA